MAQQDCLVIGAGIVGVSTALHLLRRGRNVVLVDRQPPGRATSYGNSGVIERDALEPIVFPSSAAALLAYARNTTVPAHYHVSALPRVWPWLMALRRYSRPEALERYAVASNALASRAFAEHHALAAEAGIADLFRDTGWLRIYRTPQSFAAAEAGLLAQAERFGVDYQIVSAENLAEIEPSLTACFHRGVLFPQTRSVSSPGDVTRGYADLFVRGGGRLEQRMVKRIVPDGAEGFLVGTDGETMRARTVVVALGPWSMDLVGPLGYRLPLAVKRGYHRHYRPAGDARLGRPVVDTDHGFVITPMKDGIRLTTGIEFASRDAPPTPVQLTRAEPLARALFPLDEPVEDEPWMGARPCFPDSLPMFGPAPRHPGLWFNFGHGHLGFTEGPLTGRLLAEMITGQTPQIDPAPYAADRFERTR